jgi:alkylation response protein AidB-like acyl-CoA dehydrogenase
MTKSSAVPAGLLLVAGLGMKSMRVLMCVVVFASVATATVGAPLQAAETSRPRKHWTVIHTIFEGTSEIQQLVIARAISGMRIE